MSCRVPTYAITLHVIIAVRNVYETLR